MTLTRSEALAILTEAKKFIPVSGLTWPKYLKAIAHLAAEPADGFVLVPREPNPEMLAHFWAVCTGSDWLSVPISLSKRQLVRATKAYRQMLAIALTGGT